MNTGEACRIVRAQVGGNVGRLCRDKGLSQTRFSAMIGVDRSHINQLIGGKHNVSLDVLVKIADGLDVPLTELFFGIDHVPPHLLVEYDDGRHRHGDAGA